MGQDISAIVLEALNSDIWTYDINETYIALIPNIKTPTKVSEFRPIGLYNVINMIIPKVMNNRLKSFLPMVEKLHKEKLENFQ